MLKFLIFISLFNLAYAETCVDLVSKFTSKTTQSKKTIYSKVDLVAIKEMMKEFNFSDSSIETIEERLTTHTNKVDISNFRLYFQYINTFRGEKYNSALYDINQLGQREINSHFILDFNLISERLPKKYWLYKSQMNYDEFSNLYFSCKSAVPNPKNNNAKKLFSKFSMGLSNITLVASYSYYNKDKEKNFKWFSELGYEVTFNSFTSYLGSKIQTNQADPQLIKSIKSYFMNRIFGLGDMVMYPVFFANNSDKVNKKLEEIKGSPNFNEEVELLHKYYDERGLYTKFKEHVVNTYKEILKNGEKVEVAGIDWSNLTPEDLERPEIQEVLTLAATAELYELNRGPFLDTGDSGLDRYAFSSFASALLIPKNMAQSYISYQILCMGQKNPATALTKAAIFTSSLNFFVGNVFYSARKEAINQ